MNRKVVIIVVLVECIMAVFLISFFGQAIFNNNRNVKTQEIYFTYENGEKIEDDVTLEVELSDKEISYQLHWKAEPDNVTDKSVTFISSKPDLVFVSDEGLVTFLVETDVSITIKTLDESNKSDTIVLVPQRDTEGEFDG